MKRDEDKVRNERKIGRKIPLRSADNRIPGNNQTVTRTIPSRREVQLHRDNIQSNSNSPDERRPDSECRDTIQVRKTTHDTTNIRPITGNDEAPRQRTIQSRNRITLKDIHEALTEAQLKSLYENTFDPDEEIVITQTITKELSSYGEDSLILKKKIYSQKRTKRIEDNYSIYSKHYNRYKEGKRNADANVVFGCYLVVYKKEFGEVDPEWAGTINCTRVLNSITRMTEDLNTTYEAIIIEFVETILPLWAKRLRNNESFPNSRPTVDGLFIRRKIWAQRNLYIRQWSQSSQQ